MIVAVADTHTAIWYLFKIPNFLRMHLGQLKNMAEMVYLAEKDRIPANAVQDLIHRLLDPEYPLHELPVDAFIVGRMLPSAATKSPTCRTALLPQLAFATVYP